MEENFLIDDIIYNTSDLYDVLKKQKNKFTKDLIPLYSLLLEESYKRKDLNFKVADTALIEFVINSKENSCYLLRSLLLNGADPNIRLKNNATPLMLISSTKEARELAIILLYYGANPDLQDDFGKKASDYVIEINKDSELLEILKSKETKEIYLDSEEKIWMKSLRRKYE